MNSAVLTALQTSTAFSTFYGQKFYKRCPPDFINLPVGSYFQLGNVGSLYADNKEVGSEIIHQVDLWGETSLTPYMLATDDVMASLDYARIACEDLYETDTKMQHISMRFRLDISDPDF
jgi:hypothetical protein